MKKDPAAHLYREIFGTDEVPRQESERLERQTIEGHERMSATVQRMVDGLGPKERAVFDARQEMRKTLPR
jgi:hypothetical protein